MIIDTTVFVIICIVIGILLLKPVMIMFIYILMLLGVPYNKKKTLIRKIMAAPTVILNRVAPGLDRYALYHISLLPLMSVRKLIYRTLGASIGKNVRIHFKAEIRGITKLKIEEGSIVGDNAILDARNKLGIFRKYPTNCLPES